MPPIVVGELPLSFLSDPGVGKGREGEEERSLDFDVWTRVAPQSFPHCWHRGAKLSALTGTNGDGLGTCLRHLAVHRLLCLCRGAGEVMEVDKARNNLLGGGEPREHVGKKHRLPLARRSQQSTQCGQEI